MAARSAKRSAEKAKSNPPSSGWAQYVLLFALFFVGLMLLHAPLLRLPYFWDEAGYYVPAARDLFLTGALIPHSTLSNAHPPLIMTWLALAWRIFGYSTLVTRTAMLAVSAFALLGVIRLSRLAANLPAAGLTFWALGDYLEDRPLRTALWFSAAALAKETAILAPLALAGWELL